MLQATQEDHKRAKKRCKSKNLKKNENPVSSPCVRGISVLIPWYSYYQSLFSLPGSVTIRLRLPLARPGILTRVRSACAFLSDIQCASRNQSILLRADLWDGPSSLPQASNLLHSSGFSITGRQLAWRFIHPLPTNQCPFFLLYFYFCPRICPLLPLQSRLTSSYYFLRLVSALIFSPLFFLQGPSLLL